MQRKTIILSTTAIAFVGGLALADETVSERRTYEHRSMEMEVPQTPPPAVRQESNTVQQRSERKSDDGSVEEHSTYESTRSNVERTPPPPPPRVREKSVETIEKDT